MSAKSDPYNGAVDDVMASETHESVGKMSIFRLE